MWQKLSAALGSATPDSTKSMAAQESIPPPSVANKPAPGRTGPRGLSPRTTYTRVNTGAPPVPDAGTSGQKTQNPRGLEFLPAKVAHQEKTSMTTAMKRPQIHDLVKEAMVGTIGRMDITAEANRQLLNLGQEPLEKQASAPPSTSVPTDYIEKLAGAMEFAAGMLKEAEIGTTKLKPGEGPNALQVLEAPSGENPVQPGNQGKATDKNTPPQSPATQASGVSTGDPSNAMSTNDEMMHGEQPVEPISNEKSKAAAALYTKNLAALGLTKEGEGGEDWGTRGGLAQDITAMQALKGSTPDEAREAYIGKNRRAGGIAGGVLGGMTGGMAGLPVGEALASRIGGTKGKVLGAAAGAGLTGLGALGGALGGRSLGGREAELTAAYHRAMEEKAAAGEKAASANPDLYAKNLSALGLQKQAEDALNPAKVAAPAAEATGADPPKDASPSEEQVPSEPSDVNSQKSMISSNDAAINYKKNQAKKDPVSDVGDVVTEPAMSAAHDKTLNMVFGKTREAGAKIASDMTRTAAAQALLAKYAAEAKKCKEKQSMMPAGVGGSQTLPTTAEAATGKSTRSASTL